MCGPPRGLCPRINCEAGQLIKEVFPPPGGAENDHIFLIGGDFLKPINPGGHAAYQARLTSLLKQYYPDAFTRFGSSLWNTIGKFFSIDLSKIDVLMYDRYSILGPRPRLPSDMIRSFLLSLIMKKTSFTS